MDINPRYQNGKIYTIRCKYDDTLIYVGSTIQKLCMRMGGHRRNESCSLNQYVKGDWDNWYIELYEDYPCNNKSCLEKREGEIIRLIGNINKSIADKILEQQKEDYQKKADKILQKQKEHYQNNRDKLLEYQKEHYQNNREKIIQRVKEYRQDNAEKIAEKDKERYNANRDKKLEKMKEQITCDKCKSIVIKCGLKRHQRSQRCLNYNVNNN